MEETLGKRIIANRKRLGMTQDKLAEQLGITAQAVSKWENDQSRHRNAAEAGRDFWYQH